MGILFAAENTPKLQHLDDDRLAMVETDASDFHLGAILFQKFEEYKVHPILFI
jgi:hypothetical protein